LRDAIRERVRTKKELLRSRDRLLIGAAMIEDLFR
jgi:hypothetical protein